MAANAVCRNLGGVELLRGELRCSWKLNFLPNCSEGGVALSLLSLLPCGQRPHGKRRWDGAGLRGGTAFPAVPSGVEGTPGHGGVLW